MATKKGSSNMYVYNFENFKAIEPNNTKKKSSTTTFVRGYWAGLRRPKAHPKTEGGRPVAAEGGGGEKVEGGRKSSSSMIDQSRKSVCNVEVNVGSTADLLQVKVVVSDMPGFMQVHAFRCARTTYDSLEKFSPKHLAYNLKKEFDKVYGPAWHCIVGYNFGSFVTHATGCFLYFSMEKLYILVFKTKVQKVVHK